MTRAFRICMTRHLSTALTGEGAGRYGGRWNSPGNPVIYTSSSLSLATLEVLVHLEDPDQLAAGFSWIPLEIPDHLIESFPELPTGWAEDEPAAASQSIGDAWLKTARSAVLSVPSVVTPVELNYLINPAHKRFSEIVVGQPHSFRPDSRLLHSLPFPVRDSSS